MHPFRKGIFEIGKIETFFMRRKYSQKEEKI